MKVINKKLDYEDSYNQFDISSIDTNHTLTFNIWIKKDKDFSIIIEAGTTISESLLKKLQKQEKLYIYKHDVDKQSLTFDTLKYYVKYNKDNNEARFKLLYQVSEKLFDDYLCCTEDKLNAKCIESLIQSILYLIKHDKKFVHNSIKFFHHHDEMYSHSLHIAIYAMNIGNVLKYKDSELMQLGTAAFLIDIGNKKIPYEILHKTTALTKEETKIIHMHPSYSVDIMKKNHILDPRIINTIMQHHERQDHNGYPNALYADAIDDFASIVAVCDVFDSLTSERSYRKSFTTFEALRMMTKEMKNKFNTEYLHIFVKSL